VNLSVGTGFLSASALEMRGRNVDQRTAQGSAYGIEVSGDDEKLNLPIEHWLRAEACTSAVCSGRGCVLYPKVKEKKR